MAVLQNIKPQLRPPPISPVLRPLHVSSSPAPHPRSWAPALLLENLPSSPLSLRMATLFATPTSAPQRYQSSRAPSTFQEVKSCPALPVLPPIVPSFPFSREALDAMGIFELAHLRR